MSKMIYMDNAATTRVTPVKVHCSLLAEQAIHAALWDYAEKNIWIQRLLKIFYEVKP